ncbi:MAG TPA: PPC domain-containing protein [Gemmataceae bacterium]|nr:PPC domain-containing protein [Gemmataceae bacterium]
MASVLCVLCGESFSAPPAITYLYPAGGQRGTTVDVTVGGTFERWPVQVWTSDKAITANASKDKGKLSIAIAADAVPGVHWLRLHDEQGASTLRPFIVGTLPDVAEKEPNDEPTKAQTIKLPTVVNGRLEKAGDVDVFSVTLKKGETLVASVDAHRSLKSPMDGVLQVLSADGFVLEQNNDWHGLDPQIIFNVPKDGTYLVRLFAFPAVADASIKLSGGETYIYRLTLTTGGFADYAMPLAVERKAAAKVGIKGWNISAAARPLAVSVEGDVATVFHPLLANPVRFRLENHPCWDAARTDGPLAVPFSATGQLTKAGDANSFSITGKKGQAIAIRVESRALELPVNPVIRVLDTAKKQLAIAEPPDLNKDAELAFNPPADGTYTIEVRDLHGGGGPRFVYRLRVAPPEPDFELMITTDRFALAPGKPLDIPITVMRKAGFARDVEVTAEGLPAGVSAAVVPATGKADPAKLTLRLATEKAGPSEMFTIVGRTKEPSLTRTAKAPLAEFETTTSHLWLAVGGEVPAAAPKKKK